MKKIFLTAVACFAMLMANAQTFSLENVNYVKGEAGSFDICLKSDADQYCAYSFFIYVPEGLNLPEKKSKQWTAGDAAEDWESPNYTWTISPKSAEAKPGYKAYSMVAYDSDKTPLATSEGGCLVSINYLASDIDNLGIILTKMTVSDANAKQTNITEDINTAISTLSADDSNANGAVAYDLTGRKTTANAKGIKVINGKKVIK